MANRKTAEEIQAEQEEQEREERLRFLQIIDECLTPYLAAFEPANLRTADEYMTTQELSFVISNHLGQVVPTVLLVEYLKSKDYIFARPEGSTELKWLLHKF
jgi:hypothetical protein